MGVDYQILFNIAFSVILLGSGWMMRVLFDTIKDLRSKDQDIYDKVSELSINIPIHYVRKDDFMKLTDRLFAKLDYIADRVDKKADK
jgi:hypothetical protein